MAAATTVQSTSGAGLATSAIGRLAQEFLLKKVTTHTHPPPADAGK